MSPCRFSAATENALQTYAAQAVAALGTCVRGQPLHALVCGVLISENCVSPRLAAESGGVSVQWNIAAWAGKGVVRNFNSTGGPCMPELWQRTIANDASYRWNFSSWVCVPCRVVGVAV